MCDNEIKLQGSRHGGIFVVPLSPQPKQYCTFESFREETPMSTVTIRQNEDFLEEDNLFDYCQCVNSSSEGELVTAFLQCFDKTLVSSLETRKVAVHLDCKGNESLVLTKEKAEVSEIIIGKKNENIVKEEYQEVEEYQYKNMYIRCLKKSSKVCSLQINPIAASSRIDALEKKIKKTKKYYSLSKRAPRSFNLTWSSDKVLLFWRSELMCKFKLYIILPLLPYKVTFICQY